jgi:hypothetical protein
LHPGGYGVSINSEIFESSRAFDPAGAPSRLAYARVHR